MSAKQKKDSIYFVLLALWDFFFFKSGHSFTVIKEMWKYINNQCFRCVRYNVKSHTEKLLISNFFSLFLFAHTKLCVWGFWFSVKTKINNCRKARWAGDFISVKEKGDHEAASSSYPGTVVGNKMTIIISKHINKSSLQRYGWLSMHRLTWWSHAYDRNPQNTGIYGIFTVCRLHYILVSGCFSMLRQSAAV